jgi:ubiquinone biosynthesis protein UbiJ
MNPTVHTTAIVALEHAINRALKLDPAAFESLGKLQGKIFKLDLAGTPINLYLLPAENGLQLRGFMEGPVDTHVKGTIADFVELISAADAPSTLINGGISIRGDSAPLLQLIDVLQALNLDWEMSLSTVIGDIPAHQVGQMVRNGLRWGKQTADSLARQTEEFLHEESRLLPPKAELEQFYNAIEQLSLSADRLEAKLQRQSQRLERFTQQKN